MPGTSVINIAARCAAGGDPRVKGHATSVPKVADSGQDHGRAGSSATATTSRSRTDPPAGRTLARRPRDRPRPIRNGKNASEAQAAPTVASCRASPGPWRRPDRAASTREVWPLPSPTSRRSRTRTIAFEVTPRTRRQARSRSSRSASVGAAARDARPAGRVVGGHVRGRHEDGAAGRPDRAGRVGAGPRTSSSASASSRRTRRFGLVARTRGLRSSNAGATTISRKIDTRRSAIARDRPSASAPRRRRRRSRDRPRARRPRHRGATGVRPRRTGSCA